MGRADVLVGTQLVAKGLDLPKVTVVGIINADIGLTLPDFRAAERVFQLLSQAAGRAGRASDPGSVIIQTYNPEHYAIQAGRATRLRLVLRAGNRVSPRTEQSAVRPSRAIGFQPHKPQRRPSRNRKGSAPNEGHAGELAIRRDELCGTNSLLFQQDSGTVSLADRSTRVEPATACA